ncbi:MAG: hypothetical protein M3516_07780 [Actinomycetota bacterium]|nr:hypothetical protein [Actinomycetota bacterium]
MTRAVAAIVILGLALSIALGAAFGVDATALILLALIAAFGALAVSVARKARAGTVRPAVCPSCEGFNSPNAPYCKHCGTHLVRDRDGSIRRGEG